MDQVHRLLVTGVPALTVNPGAIADMAGHPGTAIAMEGFTANGKAAYGRAAFSTM